MKLFNKAKWIWKNGYDRENTYLRFYDKILYQNGIVQMYISVDTNYALYVNGALADFGQYADFPFDKIYDKLDITKYLTAGNNDIFIDCWHSGRDSSTGRKETAGLIFEIYENSSIISYSSADTAVTPLESFDMGDDVELVSVQLGHSFRFDSTKSLRAPENSDIADKTMPGRLRPIKKLVMSENVPAVLHVSGSFIENGGIKNGERMQRAYLSHKETNEYRLLPSDDGYALEADADSDGIFAVIDTKLERAGVLSLDIDVDKDCELLIGWGEHLTDLRVSTCVGDRNFCASYFAHKGRNLFVNPLRRLGMRYLQLNIYSCTAKIRYAGVRNTDYPLEHDVKFSCSDNLHEKIYEVGKRTLRTCMHEHYEDCPWREQALYAMDARTQMLCGYYAFREYDFAKASIRLIAESLRDDNLIELCAPARVDSTIPSFSAIFPTMLYEYVCYSGDVEFAREVLPAAVRIAEELISRIDNKYGLIRYFKGSFYWNFYEWQVGLAGDNADSELDTFDAPLVAFVSLGLRSLSNLLEVLGRRDQADRYTKIHHALNDSLNMYIWDEKKSVYSSYLTPDGRKYNYSELTNALIVYAGAASGERLDSVLRALSKNELTPVTLSHSIFKYDALMLQPDKYAKIVFDDVAEKWGHMLYSSATTFWEVMEGTTGFGNAGSLCHGWSAIPVYLYHRYALVLDGGITGLYNCKVNE